MKFHTTFLKSLVLIFLSGIAVPDIIAQPNYQQALTREKALKNATSPSDSIKVLLDVYALSDQINKDRVRIQIMNIAQRSDNKEVLTAVIRELSSSTDDTSELARLIELSDSLPEEDGKKSIQTILNMEHAEAEASAVSDSDVHNEVAEYVREGMSFGGDPYKEIQNIYRAMVYLGASSQGPLYFEYIKRLEELINKLPESDHSIRNLYYTTAALYYTRKRDYAKAVELDKQLIRELDALKESYKNDPAKQNELDYFYYVSYRRMLRNFKALTPEEVETVYANCVDLAGKNEKAAEEFGNGGLTNSYYYMATQQYDKAIPNLKKAWNNENISDFRRAELLGHLAFAMRNTGDKNGELETLRDYTRMLLNDREQRRDDMYKEIEMRNSVNSIIAREMQQQEQQRERHRVMRKTSITLVYVLAIILIFLLGAYLRLRNKVKELQTKNTRLHRNIEFIFDDGVPTGTQDLRRKNHGLKG